MQASMLELPKYRTASVVIYVSTSHVFFFSEGSNKKVCCTILADESIVFEALVNRLGETLVTLYKKILVVRFLQTA